MQLTQQTEQTVAEDTSHTHCQQITPIAGRRY